MHFQHKGAGNKNSLHNFLKIIIESKYALNCARLKKSQVKLQASLLQFELIWGSVDTVLASALSPVLIDKDKDLNILQLFLLPLLPTVYLLYLLF